MKKLLHIIAAPRDKDSRTLKVSRAFLGSLLKRCPDLKVEEVNLFVERLPELTLKRIDGKYMLLGGMELPRDLKKEWEKIISCIEQFLSADIYLLSTPMWNFGIPYRLKHYIDVIVQPKYLFRYTENGPEGLVTGKKMIVVTSRGGDYGTESPFHAYDMQEPYIKTVFGFVGFKDISFINAQPMDALGEVTREKRIKEAEAIAVKAAEDI